MGSCCLLYVYTRSRDICNNIYILGTAGILWWLFWCVLVYDTPSSHPRISKEEREYLEETVSHDKVRNFV